MKNVKLGWWGRMVKRMLRNSREFMTIKEAYADEIANMAHLRRTLKTAQMQIGRLRLALAKVQDENTSLRDTVHRAGVYEIVNPWYGEPAASAFEIINKQNSMIGELLAVTVDRDAVQALLTVWAEKMQAPGGAEEILHLFLRAADPSPDVMTGDYGCPPIIYEGIKALRRKKWLGQNLMIIDDPLAPAEPANVNVGYAIGCGVNVKGGA